MNSNISTVDINYHNTHTPVTSNIIQRDYQRARLEDINLHVGNNVTNDLVVPSVYHIEPPPYTDKEDPPPYPNNGDLPPYSQ